MGKVFGDRFNEAAQISALLRGGWLAYTQQSMNLVDRVCHFLVKRALAERRRRRTRVARDAVVDSSCVWISRLAPVSHKIPHGRCAQFLSPPTLVVPDEPHIL